MQSMEERTAGRGNLRSKVAGVVPAYTLKAVRRSCLLDAVVVNTEDQEISGIATVYNRQVIHCPMSLPGARVQNTDVVRHALGALGEEYGYVALLQPTSPLRAVMVGSLFMTGLKRSCFHGPYNKIFLQRSLIDLCARAINVGALWKFEGYGKRT